MCVVGKFTLCLHVAVVVDFIEWVMTSIITIRRFCICLPFFFKNSNQYHYKYTTLSLSSICLWCTNQHTNKRIPIWFNLLSLFVSFDWVNNVTPFAIIYLVFLLLILHYTFYYPYWILEFNKPLEIYCQNEYTLSSNRFAGSLSIFHFSVFINIFNIFFCLQISL